MNTSLCLKPPFCVTNYYIEDKGLFHSSYRSVSKNAFRAHQQKKKFARDPSNSISRLIQALAVGILAGTFAGQHAISDLTGVSRFFVPALTIYVWSQMPIALAQSTTIMPAPASGLLGDEFQINSYTAKTQSDPSTAVLKDGRFVVTWNSNAKVGTDYSMFGQLFDKDGKKIGIEFQINTTPTGYLLDSYVAALKDGGFVVVWSSHAGTVYSVLGQRFDASGQKAGNEFPINTYAAGTPNRPCIEILSQGNFVVISVGISGSYGFIYGQLYDAMGQKMGIEFIVNTHMASNKLSPSVSGFSDGSFVVVWASNDGQDGSRAGIYGQRVNNSGGKIGGEFLINTFTTGDQDIPDVKVFSTDDFVVAWESLMQDGDAYGVYFQLFDKNGQKKGGEILISTYTKSYQQRPRIGILPNDDFVIVWESTGQDSTGTTGIFGQRFDKTGKKVGSEFPVNLYVTSYQERPFIATFSTGAYVVAWNSYGQDGMDSGIFGRIFSDNRALTTIPTTSLSTALTTIAPQTTTATTRLTTISNTLTPTTSLTASISTIMTTQQSSNFSTSGLTYDPSVMTVSTSEQTNAITLLNSNDTTHLTSVVDTVQSAHLSTDLNSETNSIESMETIHQMHPSATQNVQLIAGLASAVAALLFSMIIGVIYHVRQKSKRPQNEEETGTQLTNIPVANRLRASPDRPDSVMHDNVINRSHRYGSLPQNSTGEYYSARTNPDLSHYSSPIERIEELARNPSQATYGNSQDLEQLNQAIHYQSYIQLPDGLNHQRSHYSNPLDRVKELEMNPPQFVYSDAAELERLNRAVTEGNPHS